MSRKPKAPLVPYARDQSGRLYLATDVLHRNTLLLCPDCDHAIFLRKGRIRKAHFAHKCDPSRDCAFSGESPSHFQAKHLVALLFLKAQRGEISVPKFRLMDESNGKAKVLNLAEIASVSIEGTIVCQNGSRRRADVLICWGAGPALLAVELFHSHAVNEAKEAALAKIPWIELHCDEVLRIGDSDGVIWNALRHGGLIPKPTGVPLEPWLAQAPPPLARSANHFGAGLWEFTKELGRGALQLGKDIWTEVPPQVKTGLAVGAVFVVLASASEDS